MKSLSAGTRHGFVAYFIMQVAKHAGPFTHTHLNTQKCFASMTVSVIASRKIAVTNHEQSFNYFLPFNAGVNTFETLLETVLDLSHIIAQPSSLLSRMGPSPSSSSSSSPPVCR